MSNSIIATIKTEIEELTKKVEQATIKEESYKNEYYDFCDVLSKNFIDSLYSILGNYEDSFKIKFQRIYPNNYHLRGNGVEFSCEMGFVKDQDSNIFEFGSSFYFYFKDGKVKINSGTIGDYGLDDKYQLMRNKMIYYITCVHGELIEKTLSNIDVSYLVELCEKFCNASGDLRIVSNELKSKEKELIEQMIGVVGTTIIYDAEKANQMNRIDEVGSHYGYKSEKFVITKITTKFVIFYTYNMGNDRLVFIGERIRKSRLIDAINSGVMLIVR